MAAKPPEPDGPSPDTTERNPSEQSLLEGNGAEAEPVAKAAEVLKPFLKNPNEAPRVLLALKQEFYSGPLPHPRHLAAFEQIAPGTVQTLIRMATREQAHRHRMQTAEIIYPYCGMIAGFVGLFGCIAASAYLGLRRDTTVALALLGVPVLGVLGYFINGRLASHDRSRQAPPDP
jgi:uncharacterized membrane protein